MYQHQYKTRSKKYIKISEEEALLETKRCFYENIDNKILSYYLYPNSPLLEDTIYYLPFMNFQNHPIPLWREYDALKPSLVYWPFSKKISQGINLEANILIAAKDNKPSSTDLLLITHTSLSIFILSASIDYLQKVFGKLNKINFTMPLLWSDSQESGAITFRCQTLEKAMKLQEKIIKDGKQIGLELDSSCFRCEGHLFAHLIIVKDYLDRIYGQPQKVNKNEIYSYFSDNIFPTFSLISNKENITDSKSALFSPSVSNVLAKSLDTAKNRFGKFT